MAIWQYGNMASDDDDYDGGGDDGDGNMTSDKWRAINWWKHRGAVEESSGAHIPVKYTKYTIFCIVYIVFCILYFVCVVYF